MADFYDTLGRRVGDRFDAFGNLLAPPSETPKPLLPSSDKWITFEPSQLFPSAIQQGVSSIDDAVKGVVRVGKITTKALRFAQRVASNVPMDPGSKALQIAIDRVDEFLSGVMGRAQCHAIMIPIRRKTVRRGADHASMFDAFLDPAEPAYAYVEDMVNARAGTKKFFTTFVDSFADAGDVNRPQFPPTYATTGVCLIAGAESLSDLQAPLRLFSTLFTGNHRIPPAGFVLPVVQDLRVLPAAVRDGVGVSIRWQPLPPRTTIPFISSDVLRASEIFIIRSSQPLVGTTWEEVFPGVTVSDSRTDLPSNARARVVARLQNHGFASSYTDTTNLLDPDETYYFTMCVRYTINDGDALMGPFSNSVRVLRTQPAPTTRQAVPPDWVATPRLSQLIPALDRVVNRARLELQRLRPQTRPSGVQQLAVQAISQLERLIQQWEQTTEELTELTGRLQAITAFNAPSGIYATVITQPTGGHGAWVAELSRRLSDTSDPNRPNLSDQSIVIGFVIMAGAPRLPELAELRRVLEIFFGKQDKNPLQEVNRVLDSNPAAPATAPSTPSRVLGYDAALRPSSTPTC